MANMTQALHLALTGCREESQNLCQAGLNGVTTSGFWDVERIMSPAAQVAMQLEHGGLSDLVDVLREDYLRYGNRDTCDWTYALALVHAGRPAEARAVAERGEPIRRDYMFGVPVARGHGAWCDGLNRGRIEIGRLRATLAALPLLRAADGRIAPSPARYRPPCRPAPGALLLTFACRSP